LRALRQVHRYKFIDNFLKTYKKNRIQFSIPRSVRKLSC